MCKQSPRVGFSLQGALGMNPIPFSAPATQVRHCLPLQHDLRHDISPVPIPAELALNSEEKKQLNY